MMHLRITFCRTMHINKNPRQYAGAFYLLFGSFKDHLKSLGRLSTLLHFSHSAIVLTLLFSKMVFIFISPPQEQ